MTQKTISLNEKAYAKLKKIKKKGETYSDLILRLCISQEQSDEDDLLLKLIGAFKEDADYWEQVEKQVQQSRETHLISEDEE
ncbi:MAG: antitoxin VapB family protein [Candidatus Helarchaeota archaeon]